MSLSYKFVKSPIGNLKLVASEQGVVAILWEKDRPRRVVLDDLVENAQQPILKQTEAELGEYFAGKRTECTVALDMRGTPFQKQVWEALLGVPYGETEPTANSPINSETLERLGLLARRTVETLSPSSRPVIA